ncbi:hypothetical protein [Roseofilum capinflatum]|uniref:Uncharacterized protein n=1 Tax=Roseofilum capinflatum BLCC-M114 TaxID=3022440 RepID=A0ABT7B5M7_9CYAN|nr:hypothetical protein [Roseofilum capinflatum]MDJ1174483.1 hypothetical protein [Roseofilum capinflatum BLCC-M114]
MQLFFAPQLAKNPSVIKLRLHLLYPIETSNRDFSTVSYDQHHSLKLEAALEISFKNRLSLRRYLESDEYKTLTVDMPKYIKSFQPYPQRSRSTLVYNGQPTLVGQRGLVGAQSIEQLGAINQIQESVTQLMLVNR